MFDLFRSRAKAVRYLLGAILLVVAFSMVVTLVPGFVGSAYDSSANPVLAEVGNDTITAREAQLWVAQEMRNGNIPNELAGTYVPLVVDQMIAQRAVADYARRMGFEVGDSEVAFTVESLVPSLFQGGQFIGSEYYSQYLSQMGFTIPQFEDNIRKERQQFKLTHMAREAVVVSDKEIEAEYRRQNNKIRLDYVSINPAPFRSQVSATQDDLQAYYQAHQSEYQLPEQRDVQLILIEESSVSASATIPESQLRQAYASQLDRFQTEERVRVRHILFDTTNKTDEEKQQAEQKAEEVLQQLRDGADFEELAREYSEDVGTAASGGELGWVTRGQLVSSFASAAFALAPGQISDVVATEYGYHIIQLEEKQGAQVQSFEEVRGQLEQELSRQFVYDRMQDLADTVERELTAAPSTAAQIAQKHGLEFRELSRFTKDDSIPALSSNTEALNLLASLGQGQVTPVMQGGETTLAVGTVTAVYPARPSEFSEVEDRVRTAVIQEKAADLARQKAAELEEYLKTAPEDLAGAARSVGLEMGTSDPIALNEPAGELGSGFYYQEAFDSPVGAVLGPINTGAQAFYVKVIEKTEADMSGLPAQRQTILNGLRGDKRQLRIQLLNDGILNRMTERGEVKINQDAIDNLVSAYRSTSS